MSTKREITKKYAREYDVSSKKARGRMPDELVAPTTIRRFRIVQLEGELEVDH